MPVVRLGHLDGNVTTAQVPDSYTRRERFDSITARDGVWVNHTDKDPDREPVWVASDDPSLESVLAIFYECEQGEPGAGVPNEVTVVEEGGQS